MKYVENSESSPVYHRWTAMSLIAGALQRKVWFKRGHTTLYPNIYVILVGPSGLSRKGEPLTVGRQFLEGMNISIIAEDNSKESLIRDMHDCSTQFTDTTSGRIMNQSAISCFAEELAVFLGYQNVALLADMTNWYDSRDKWERRTKHQGIDEVNGVCFNFLATTDPSWLPSILPREAVGGGFTSRVIFVVQDKKAKTIPNPDLYPPNAGLRDRLMDDLESMNRITGPMRFDRHAREFYDAWYIEQDRLIETGEHPLTSPFLRGYLSRRPTHLTKLGMLHSASRSNELIISRKDLEDSLRMLEEIEPKMHEVFRGISDLKFGKHTAEVLDFIREHGPVHKSKILRTMTDKIDSYTFDQVIKTLLDSRQVEAKLDVARKEPIYGAID
ncbi:MAG: hypothetical protein C5B59_17340 [Bacteroidetes bacterium]|nr:MAG: hypothetical protein C5B59_17340 [Bacteroidota bacterium]